MKRLFFGSTLLVTLAIALACAGEAVPVPEPAPAPAPAPAPEPEELPMCCSITEGGSERLVLAESEEACTKDHEGKSPKWTGNKDCEPCCCKDGDAFELTTDGDCSGECLSEDADECAEEEEEEEEDGDEAAPRPRPRPARPNPQPSGGTTRGKRPT